MEIFTVLGKVLDLLHGILLGKRQKEKREMEEERDGEGGRGQKRHLRRERWTMHLINPYKPGSSFHRSKQI
jgi:hypothetical protein